MQVIDSLMNKCGIASIKLSKMFLDLEVDTRIPTVTEISTNYNLPRGTVQNAIKNITDLKAIKLQAKGSKGTFLVEKNTKILLEIIGVSDLAGIMPFPYTRRHDGLASGLIKSLDNSELPVYIAYMSGSVKRLKMVEQKRYDFTIVSKLLATKYIEKYGNLKILIEFGNYTYLSRYVICFSNKMKNEIEDGMKIGINEEAIVSYDITKDLCENNNVNFVETKHTQAIDKILTGDLDAIVIDLDEIEDRELPVHYVEVESLNDGYENEAVLVTLEDSLVPESYLKSLIDKDVVLETQKMVVENNLRLL